MKKCQLAAVRILVILSLSGTATGELLPPQPEHPQVDENGVDVQTRMSYYTRRGVSIGPADHRGLSYDRFVSGDGTLRHSFSSTLFVATENNISSFAVTFGNKGRDFGSSTTDGMGAGVSNSGYYLRDGASISFGNHGFGYSDSETLSTYSWTYADAMYFPDGVVWTLHHKDAVGGPYGFTYTRLQSVTSNTGYQLKYYYMSDDITAASESLPPWWTISRVVAINNAVEYCDPMADSCSLSNTWPDAEETYSGTSHRMIDAEGNVTLLGLGYAIETPTGTTHNHDYTMGSYYHPDIGTVYGITQANIDGKITNYDYAYSGTNHTTTVNSYGPVSDNRTYVANRGEPGIISFKNALNLTTQFTHDWFGRVKTATSPEGNWTEFVYDNDPTLSAPWYARGNITLATAYPKSGSGLAPLSESWTFPSSCYNFGDNSRTCNKPETYTDPRGATTSYTYAAHGGILTETKPADINGVQPVKRYAYAQRYAWFKNSGGGYVQAPTPVWVLTEERTCQASATVGNGCAAGSSDEIVTAYDYGPTNSVPNNLLVRGVVVTTGGQSRRTCYGYDVLGNKISETLPRSGLGSCP